MTVARPPAAHARVRRLLFALASGAAGFAQTRLYLLTSGDPSWECDVAPCNPGRVIQIDVDRRQITASTPIEHARGFTTGPGITPDGGFLIWGGSETSGGWDEIKPVVVSLFDLASQRQSILLASQQSVPVFVHPSKMRAFVQLWFSQPLTVLEPGQVRAQPSPSCGDYNNTFLDRISGDGGRLSYYCAGIASGVIVVDSTDGRVAGAVPAGEARMPSTTTAARSSPSTGWAVRRSIGGLTWRPVPSWPSGAAPLRAFWGVEPAYDRRLGRLYTGDDSTVLVLDATTLTEIGRIDGPAPGMRSSIVLDPERPEAYVAWWRYSEERYRQTVHVYRVSTETLAILESLQLPVDGLVVGLTIGPRPPALSDLNVVVDQRVATLTWTIAASRSIATGQVVEAGLTAGRNGSAAAGRRWRHEPHRPRRPAGALLRARPVRERHRPRHAVERGGGRRAVGGCLLNFSARPSRFARPRR